MQLLLIVCCIIAILMTDSRGAMLFSVMSVLFMLLPRRMFIYARWFIFFLSALPLFAFTLAPSFFSTTTRWANRPKVDWQNAPSNQTDVLCMEAINNYNGTLSNRPIIWDIVLNNLKQPKGEQIIGYGIRGHIASSISKEYSCLFASYANPEIASSHNIWLQLILDLGYLGLATTLVLFASLLVVLGGKNGRKKNDHLVGMLLYIVLIGSLEAPLAADFGNVYMLFLAICTIALFLINNSSEQRK